MPQIDQLRPIFLAAIQESFPLCTRPFAALGEQFGITETEAIALYAALKAEGIIRQTSAILDTKKLGYSSSLVAFALDDRTLAQEVALINSHPGVSHNYQRNHYYNLWFTLAVPPDSLLGLEKTVQLLARATNARHVMVLPTLKMFKLSVRLDTAKTRPVKEKTSHRFPLKEILLTPQHTQLLSLIQDDISATNEPFADMINTLGVQEGEFFALIDDLTQSGMMRRFATILNHRRAGFSTNAMVVWDIPDDQAMSIGTRAAEFSAVSHCYLRPRYQDWPYNLFTMIHASSSDELTAIIAQMRQEIPAQSFCALDSLYEYKKSRIRYFTPDIKIWEQNFMKEYAS